MVSNSSTSIHESYQYPAYPILNANSDGAQLEKSMHLLSEQMEEIKSKEAALKESTQKCEEQKALVQKQFEILKHQLEELNIKEPLLSAKAPPTNDKIEQVKTASIEILKSTGQILKENWKTVLVLGVITAGAVWVYHKIQTTQLPTIHFQGGFTSNSYRFPDYKCDITITPAWPKA